MVVSNVAEAIQLFETYFRLTCTEIKGDHIIAVLKGKNDFTLVIMKDKNGKVLYPEAFHIGFMLDNEEVLQTYCLIKNRNIAMRAAPQKIRDSFGFYFIFDNLMIAVGHYLA